MAAFGLMACDTASTPFVSNEAKRYAACLKKRDLRIDGYVIAATVEPAASLCSEEIGAERAMMSAALLGKYVTEETPDCEAARRALIFPITDRVAQAFRADGEKVFCAWVKTMLDQQNSQLWLRFWR
jgi:hypothetical protein